MGGKGFDNWSFYRFYIFVLSTKGQARIWNFGWKVLIHLFQKITGSQPKFIEPYETWKKNNFPTKEKISRYKKQLNKLSYQPKISILLPVYNAPEVFFKEAIESVLNQVYSNWELCIADDCSTNENIKTIIQAYASKDERIKYVFRFCNAIIFRIL